MVEIGGHPCVIVALAGEFIGIDKVPEEHVAVWFGDTIPKKPWEARLGDVKTKVRTVPLEYCVPGQVPSVYH
jgi:hypothetical protein